MSDGSRTVADAKAALERSVEAMHEADKIVREAVSLQRAAHLLDVHEDTVRRWGRAGLIILVRVGPRLLRVPKSEIARLRAAKLSPHNAA